MAGRADFSGRQEGTFSRLRFGNEVMERQFANLSLAELTLASGSHVLRYSTRTRGSIR